MQIKKNNLMKTNQQEAVTMLENDSNKDYDLIREYANQLNGEIEDGEYREEE